MRYNRYNMLLDIEKELLEKLKEDSEIWEKFQKLEKVQKAIKMHKDFLDLSKELFPSTE